ncbi:MAG: cysteine peptidase family C39 domain-containing protein [Candidatus Roizmanbacteria bacterium]
MLLSQYKKIFLSSLVYFTIASSILSPFSVYAQSSIESGQEVTATNEAEIVSHNPSITPSVVPSITQSPTPSNEQETKTSTKSGQTKDTITPSPTITPTPSEQPGEEELAPLELGNNKVEIDSQKDMTAVVRQSQDYTCGPASLATLLTQLGEDTTEEQVLQTISPENINPEKGVSLLTLKQSAIALEKQVLLKKWSGDEVLSYIKETGDPVLIHDIKKNVGGHFSVIRSYDADKGLVELSDTEAGNIKYSVEDFKHIFTGHVLLITSEGTDNTLLNDTTTTLSDDEASTVWGKYVPVYLLAERSGDKEAIQFGKEYEACINQAMNIIDKNSRNNTRSKCYETLSIKLKSDLNWGQEKNLLDSFNKTVSSTENLSAIGERSILEALTYIKSLQSSYISSEKELNVIISQPGGMSVSDAINLPSTISSLKSQVSQYSYEKSQLENTISPKKNTSNQLNSDISRGSFSQNGVTFSLGSVGSQFFAQSSKFNNLSQSLSSKLNSFDGQIKNKRNQLNATNSNINSSRNNSNYYQNQANSYYSQYARTAWWDWRRASYWTQYIYLSGQASIQRGMTSWYEGQARNIQNEINSLESQKNNAKNEFNSQSAEVARLQRLYSFGQQEMNRKQGLLTQLNNEINSLQSQLNQRITKINSLNSQINNLISRQQTAVRITTINQSLKSTEVYINQYKARYGFTTISNTNTSETDRLFAEEQIFTKNLDLQAITTATSDYRSVGSIVTSLFPGVGEGYDVITLLGGRDPFTQESLNPLSTTLTVAGLLSVYGSGSVARKAGMEGIERIAEELGVHGNDILPIANEVASRYSIKSLDDLKLLKGKLSTESFLKEVRELATVRSFGKGLVITAERYGKEASDWLVIGEKTDRVYVALDELGNIKYVGKTNDITRRALEHGERFSILDISEKFGSSYERLTPHQARSIEQYIIDKYELVNLSNDINSIRSTRSIFEGTQTFAKDWLTKQGFNKLLKN